MKCNLTQQIVTDWEMNPFNTDLQSGISQDQLSELQADIEARIQFDVIDYSSFWMQTKNILRVPLLSRGRNYQFLYSLLPT